MKKLIYITIYFLVLCVYGENKTGKEIYNKYISIINDKSKNPKIEENMKQYLISLNKSEFMEFIKELKNYPDYNSETENSFYLIAFFIKYYFSGPGKNQALTETINQCFDPTLPNRWKQGLMGFIGSYPIDKMKDEEFSTIIKNFLKLSIEKNYSFNFKLSIFQALDKILYNKRELILKRSPQLRDSIMKQDHNALKNIQKSLNFDDYQFATMLIDSVQSFRLALKQVSEESKDNIQGSKILHRYLIDWEPKKI